MASPSEVIAEAKANGTRQAERAARLIMEANRPQEAMVHAILAVAYRLEQLATVVSIKD